MRWRSVAVPTEHGGWGLTAEPALMGALVVPSRSGLALALAAMLVFVARRPAKLVVVDLWRRRWLARSAMALRVAIVELAALVALLAAATVATHGGAWWLPMLFAAPAVAVELWFDVRSRSRRLFGELAAVASIAAVAPTIVLAGGGRWPLAGALWLLVGARSTSAVPFVRAQVGRLHHGNARVTGSDLAQLGALAASAVVVVLRSEAMVGAAVLAMIAVMHVVLVRRPPPQAKVLGIAETLVGAALVAATAIGTAIW